jgi:hypothetical protein
MKNRYGMYRRRNGWFYTQDRFTRQQKSLRTKDRREAELLVSAQNEAGRFSAMNLMIARAYLTPSHPTYILRTWREVIDTLLEGLASDPKREKWQRIKAGSPFSTLKKVSLFYTEPFHFWKVLKHPKASPATQRWLRQLQNYALSLGWLLRPVFSKKAWPKIRSKPKRAITSEEHERIIAAEADPERRNYYQMLWLVGGSQTDVANFHRDGIDHSTRTFRYQRRKMKYRDGGKCSVSLDGAFSLLLERLPAEGWFFPRIRLERCGDRADHFRGLCRRLAIGGVTLHSYRYAWAERARWSEMPPRESMQHLGHKRWARHLFYAKNAPINTLPLEYYEEKKRIALKKALGDP